METNKIDRYKILIRYMIKVGIIASQKDLGAKMGYSKESTISQIINEKVKEPKDIIDRLSAFIPDLNKHWLETGEGTMLISETGGQNFFGNINGGDNKFSGRDMTVNPPCTLGYDMERVFQEISAQRKLTEEAQAQTRKAQEQMDRLITIIENFNKK